MYGSVDYYTNMSFVDCSVVILSTKKRFLFMLIHLFLMLGFGCALGVVYVEKTNSNYFDMWGVGIFCAFMYALVDTSSKFGSEVAFLAFISLLIGMFYTAKHWKRNLK